MTRPDMMQLEMPAPRAFGWALKSTETTHFAIHTRPNGQVCVVLNHALLRGCRAEMIHWWFRAFATREVMFVDVPGYVGARAPAYLLWHPSDHHSARLSGRLDGDGGARAGATIHIREAMQYDRYGWAYPVDTRLKIHYVDGDGWAMGRSIPLFGPVMMLRIHFKDVFEDGRHIGAHYHYEVVIGVSADTAVARMINAKVTSKFGSEFFGAWHLHNTIEVGVFENFLPALFEQRDEDILRYSLDMDASPGAPDRQSGFDRALFEARLAAYRAASDPYEVQGRARPGVL
ncbi:MAG: hypothetical protein AAFR16_08790 [Pseudomonadota bacterium]